MFYGVPSRLRRRLKDRWKRLLRRADCHAAPIPTLLAAQAQIEIQRGLAQADIALHHLSRRYLSQHSPDGLRRRMEGCSLAGPWSIGTPAGQWIPGGRSRQTPVRGLIRQRSCRLSTVGAWLSPRLQPASRSFVSGHRHGWSSQALDPAQDRGEQRPWHRHLGQLEHEVAAMADDLGTDLDPDSPFGSGRHARRLRKRWRNCGFPLSPVASVRTRLPDLT